MPVPKKKRVFVIMPFKPQYQKFFEFLQKVLKGEFEIHNANTNNLSSIIKDVVVGINDADFIIADLTEKNANVYYELGIAHALGKKVIMITQKIDKLPFDIQSYRAIEYSTAAWDFDGFVSDLTYRLSNDSVEFGNPVTDYLQRIVSINGKKEKIHQESDEFSNELIINSDEEVSEDKGVIDLIDEIGEDAYGLTNAVNDNTASMGEMCEDLNLKMKQIEEAKKNQNGTVFIRKLVQDSGKIISQYSDKMASFCVLFEVTWMRIADNIDNLILSEHILANEDNKASVVQLLEVVFDLGDKLAQAKDSQISLVEALIGLKGLQSQLTKGVTALSSELEKFINLLDWAKNWVNELKEKSLPLR